MLNFFLSPANNLFFIFKAGDDFPPPAGGEAGPHGHPELVGLREVCLDQRDLLAVTLQSLLYVALLHGSHVVHL